MMSEIPSKTLQPSAASFNHTPVKQLDKTATKDSSSDKENEGHSLSSGSKSVGLKTKPQGDISFNNSPMKEYTM